MLEDNAQSSKCCICNYTINFQLIGVCGVFVTVNCVNEVQVN